MIRAGVRTTWGIAAVGMLLGLAGCGSTEAGFGLPTLSAEDSAKTAAGAPAVPLDGTLRVASNGCFLWDDAGDPTEAARWIVWPDGARQDAAEVVLASSDRVGDGSALSGRGALVSLADLPDGADSGSYFGDMGQYCGADEGGVLVLTDVRAAD